MGAKTWAFFAALALTVHSSVHAVLNPVDIDSLCRGPTRILGDTEPSERLSERPQDRAGWLDPSP
jgi:hypothetical protein